MNSYQKLRQVSNDFLMATKFNNTNQSFILGVIVGYFLQHKNEDVISELKAAINSTQQIIQSGLVSNKSFEDFVASLFTNLENPKPFDFQQGGDTPILQEEFQQLEKIGIPDNDEAATMALIKQLQEEDARTSKKKQVEVEQVDCPICYTSLMDDDVIPLENCVHIFHQNCLKELLLTSISEKRKQLKCPSQDCEKEIAINDMSHVVGTEKKDEFLNYTLNKFVDEHAADMSWCPTPDCKYAFVLGDEDENEFHCPLCKKQYCLNCRVVFHKGQSCKEYQISNTKDQNDVKFEKFVKGHKFKMCTKCKFWVEKNQGCNHMTCRCGYQFCYACGGKYLECECVQKQREQQAEFQRQQQLRMQQQQQQRQKKASRGRR